MIKHKLSMLPGFFNGAVIVLLAMTLLICSGCGGVSDGGRSASIDISASTVDFGNTVLDHFSDKEILIQNNGELGLDIGQIAQNDILSAPFSIIEDTCSGSTLYRNGKCSMKIRFQPTEDDVFSDTFNIPSNDPDNKTVTVSVEGNGRTLDVSINQVELACPDINLYVSASDKNDNFISGLDQSNFMVIEDSVLVAPEDLEITEKPQTDLSIAIVLDISGSVGDVLEETKTAAKLFVEQMGENDEATIFLLSDIVDNVLEFTSDKTTLIETIDGITINWFGHTAIYDGIIEVNEYVDENANNIRKATIIISDGADTVSETAFEDVILILPDYNIPFFSIGLNQENVDILQALSDSTGGLYFNGENSDQLDNIYISIGELLFNQYRIVYHSNSTAGNLISVEVTIDMDIDGEALSSEDIREFEGCTL